jgi:tRNA threonylcarbamoyladenosine biosynthesis protein TsaB
MLLLAFDTAGPDCAVAVARSGEVFPETLARAEERIGRGHAERLMPMIEAALREAGIAFRDLGRVAVTTGPGSFTGVRIGIAAARGLALALEIPAVGIGSLDAIAFPVSQSHRTGTLVTALDARRGEIYARVEDLSCGKLLRTISAVRPDDLAAELAGAKRPFLLAGSGAPLLASLLPTSDTRTFGAAESPDIADVVAMAFREDGGRLPSPLYLRGADAKPQPPAIALQ